MNLNRYEAYVLVSYDYYGLPSCDDVIYSSKEKAELDLIEIKKTWRDCRKKVLSLDEFFSELLYWEAPETDGW